MQIPVKITPDRIRDSIVHIFFQTDIPFEPLIGFCYQALEKAGWKYSNRQPFTEQGKGLIIELGPVNQHFFVKDNIRLQIFPNQSFAFNCIKKYMGWKQYSTYIESVISILMEANLFKSFSRLGIRYISEFPNMDILEKIKLTASLPGITGEIKNSTHRFVLEEGAVVKNVQVLNKIPANVIMEGAKETIRFISRLDIEIVKAGLHITESKTLWSEIEALHNIEKATFFYLLKEDFLQSLNPEYA